MWDPARNHYMLRPRGVAGVSDVEADANPALLRRPPAYVFDAKQLWNGLEAHGKTLCNGLLRDWVSWQQKPANGGENEFELLCRTLAQLSPHPDEIILTGAAGARLVDDTRDFPTVDMGYGDVPVIHASAGMRRVLSLAYLVVWSWREHLGACKLLRRPPVQQIVFLMDEVENHLHPAWQRRIVKALLTVLEGLSPSMRVQAHVTTHAPLVRPPSSRSRPRARSLLRLRFDAETRRVSLDEVPWAKQGDATDWLVSPAFKLEQARSVEAERAIEDAEALMRGDDPAHLKTRAEIDAELHRVLAGDHLLASLDRRREGPPPVMRFARVAEPEGFADVQGRGDAWLAEHQARRGLLAVAPLRPAPGGGVDHRCGYTVMHIEDGTPTTT